LLKVSMYHDNIRGNIFSDLFFFYHETVGKKPLRYIFYIIYHTSDPHRVSYIKGAKVEGDIQKSIHFRLRKKISNLIGAEPKPPSLYIDVEISHSISC
jgi:hypothetical protein